MIVNALEIQLRRMERLLAINYELVSQRKLDDILRQLIQAATELTDCESAVIFLVDESSDALRFIAATWQQDRLLQFPVPSAGSLAGAAFVNAQPILINNPDPDLHSSSPNDTKRTYPARSLLAVPLKFQERKIGVLQAENKNAAQYFDAIDTQALVTLATQATIAIENARQIERYKLLGQAEQTQRQMADALRLASAALTSTLDYDQVIDRILEQVSQVIPNDTSNVMIIEANNVARVFRGRGYESFGTAETLESTTLNVNDVAGLRRMRETRQPIVIPDVTQDPTWVYSRPEHHWIRSYVGAPIVLRDVVVGFLHAMRATPNYYNATHTEHLQAFAHHAASAIENARLYRRAQNEIAERIKVEAELRHHRDHLEELVKERTAEIQRLAITDSLTEIFNRRHLLLLGNQAINQAQRYRHPLSAMMIDIDHFKVINDSYGHAVGDEALRHVANQLRHHLRSADILGRYGGEEFVVLMPEADLNTARQSAERLLQNIRALRIAVAHEQISLTASIGVAEWESTAAPTIDGLITRADHAMYAAKQAGRDRVGIAKGT